MANVLSQDEVDSLLGGIDQGSVETETDVPEKDWEREVYNFNARSGPLNMPTLQVLVERCIGFLQENLSSVTNTNVEVKIGSSEMLEFNEFCSSLPLPASLNIFRINPFKGYAMLVMEGRMVFSFVESFFGGKGLRPVKLEGRAFTLIESKIITKITRIILEDFQKAWVDTNISDVDMVYSHSEIDPQFTQIAKPDDMVIVIKFTVGLANSSGTISFCIPYSTVEPVKDKLKQKFSSEKQEVDEKWKTFLEEKTRKLKIDFNVVLGTVKIKAGELMEMQVGDVIMLDQKIEEPMAANVQGITKFKGYPGSYSNHKAIKISERLNKE